MSHPDMNLRLGYPFWLRPFVVNGVAGVTLGTRVYLDASVAALPAARVAAILGHEMVHVNQYRRHGLVPFVARYAFEYVRNRIRGMSAWDAYREISFEKEAFAEELRIERTETNA